MDPEAGNAAPGSCGAFAEEMEADHGAGTAASGPCEPLKEALCSACMKRCKVEKMVALMHSTVYYFYEQR